MLHVDIEGKKNLYTSSLCSQIGTLDRIGNEASSLSKVYGVNLGLVLCENNS